MLEDFYNLYDYAGYDYETPTDEMVAEYLDAHGYTLTGEDLMSLLRTKDRLARIVGESHVSSRRLAAVEARV